MLVENFCDAKTFKRIQNKEIELDEICFETMPLEKQLINVFKLKADQIPTTIKNKKAIPSINKLKELAIERINKKTKQATKSPILNLFGVNTQK